MKLFTDSDDLVHVRWFFTDKPPLAFPTVFNSRNWLTDKTRDYPLGESRTARRPWANGSKPAWLASGKPCECWKDQTRAVIGSLSTDKLCNALFWCALLVDAEANDLPLLALHSEGAIAGDGSAVVEVARGRDHYAFTEHAGATDHVALPTVSSCVNCPGLAFQTYIIRVDGVQDGTCPASDVNGDHPVTHTTGCTWLSANTSGCSGTKTVQFQWVPGSAFPRLRIRQPGGPTYVIIDGSGPWDCLSFVAIGVTSADTKWDWSAATIVVYPNPS